MLHMYLAKGRNANVVIQSKWMVLMQHEGVHGLSVRINTMVLDITFSSRFFKVGKILDVFILPIVNFVTPGKINKKIVN